MCLRETLVAPEEAARLERAVDKVVADGVRTADLAAKGAVTVSTSGMADAVIAALETV